MHFSKAKLYERGNGGLKSKALATGSSVANFKSGPDFSVFIKKYFFFKFTYLVGCFCVRPSLTTRAGRPRGRNSSPDRVKDFHFSISFCGSPSLIFNEYRRLFVQVMPRSWKRSSIHQPPLYFFMV
jgi:hypothetical protein